jgi:hypothetical protein
MVLRQLVAIKKNTLRRGRVFFLVELVRRYSNQPGLLADLEQAWQRLRQALQDPAPVSKSVRSTGRVGRKWALADRLSDENIRGMVEGFQAGTSKRKLAALYDISESSVKRLLRRSGDSLSE